MLTSDPVTPAATLAGPISMCRISHFKFWPMSALGHKRTLVLGAYEMLPVNVSVRNTKGVELELYETHPRTHTLPDLPVPLTLTGILTERLETNLYSGFLACKKD